MKVNLHRLKPTAYVAVALFLAVVGIMQAPLTGRVHAFPVGGQIQTRTIRMSSSVIGTNVLGQGVSYLVSFKPATIHTITGIILQFCDSTSTPIIGDSTCVAPTGFSASSATVTGTPGVTPYTDLAGGTWSPSAPAANILKFTPSSAPTVTTVASPTYAFQVNGITNQTAVGTFYARMVTYVGSTAGGTNFATYAAGSEGSVSATDYGGFALSTANTISITAKVQESMTFCVSGADPTTDCGGVSPPTITLGHGANLILDGSVVDTALIYTQLSTNAQAGAVIRMKNSAASGGLNSGTNSIPPTGATIATITAGVAAFGMRTANGTGGTGTITADANYSSATQYGMDITTSGANVLSAFGDPIASSTAPVNNVENTLTFAATASNTTPAGLYSASMILVASGSF